MFYEDEIYLSKRDRPVSPYKENKIEEIKFPPVNQIQLKAVILSILKDPKLLFPISSKEIIELIKSNFIKKKGILNKIENLNYNEIFNYLKEKNAIISKKMSFGLDEYDVILKINSNKILQLFRESFSDLPNKMPEIENKLINDNIILKNTLNKKTKLADLLAEPPAIKNEKIKEFKEKQKNKTTIDLRDQFKSSTNNLLMCESGTREKCFSGKGSNCDKIHVRKIILPHTDESLGNCSYLNTCRHMDYCKFLHYKIDEVDKDNKREILEKIKNAKKEKLPMQWINCDLRQFDFSILGKFNAIMLDPPWDIHMNLPYGTLKDKEMKHMQVGKLVDDGACFLWVTGRAMELGRECLENWGFKRVEEIVWIKTNQLQGIIRTGRTGHWLNHSKEHCLVGIKGKSLINRNVDCDVLIAKVRETSRKPDEIYDLVERFAPGGRKIELFARPHNRKPGWVSLGNQLPGIYICEKDVLQRFEEKTGKKLTQEEMDKNKNMEIEDEQGNFIKSVYYNHLNKNK